MKQKFIALLLVFCMAASLCLMTGCGGKGLKLEDVEKDPVAYLKAGSEMVMEAWGFGSSGEELTALLTNLAKQGEIELNLDMTDYKLKNVLAFDGEAIYDKLTGELPIGEGMPEGSALLLNEMFYIDKEEIAVASSTFLGTAENVYGLKFEEFLAQGTESNLAKALGLTEESFDMLKTLLEGEDEAAEEDLGAMLQEWIQKMEALEEDSWALYEELDITVQEAKTTIEGAEVEAIVITVPLTTEFLKKAAELGLDLLEGMEGMEGMDEVTAAMDELEVSGSYTYYLNQETGALMQCDMNMLLDDGMTEMSQLGTVVYGIDPAAGKIVVDLVMEEDGEELADIVAAITKTTEDKVECIKMDMTVESYGEELSAVLDLDHNKENGEYTLSFDVEDAMSLQLTGVCKVEKTGAELSVKSIKMDDMTIDVNISLKVNTETEAIAKPEYQNILTMDQESLNTLFQNLYLGMGFLGSVGSYGGYDYNLSTTPDFNTDGLCEFCLDPAVTEVEYLGELWSCCASCAIDVEKVLTGNYCDICWTGTDNLTVIELEGVQYRFCADCIVMMG